MKLDAIASAALFGLAMAVEEPEGHEYHRDPADSQSYNPSARPYLYTS